MRTPIAITTAVRSLSRISRFLRIDDASKMANHPRVFFLRTMCTSSTAPSQPSSDDRYTRLKEKVKRLENRTRFRGYSVLRIGLSVLLVSGAVVYVFREVIRENLAGEVSIVATRSLGDQEVKVKVTELVNALVEAILRDPDMHAHALNFVREVFSRKETLETLTTLLSAVLADAATQKQLTEVLKRIVNGAMGDPAFRATLATNLQALLQEEHTRQGLLLLLSYAFNNDTLKDVGTTFAKDIVASDVVRNQAVSLGKDVAKTTLNDRGVQKAAGTGLWNAFGYSVTPKIFQSSTPKPEPETVNEQPPPPVEAPSTSAIELAEKEPVTMVSATAQTEDGDDFKLTSSADDSPGMEVNVAVSDLQDDDVSESPLLTQQMFDDLTVTCDPETAAEAYRKEDSDDLAPDYRPENVSKARRNTHYMYDFQSADFSTNTEDEEDGSSSV